MSSDGWTDRSTDGLKTEPLDEPIDRLELKLTGEPTYKLELELIL